MLENRIWRAGALALLLFASASAQFPQPRFDINPPMSGKRFQFWASPFVREDQFLLDTQTGDTWKLAKVDDEGAMIRVTFATSPTEIMAILGDKPTPGRFYIVFGPYARADTFLIDGLRGRTWALKKDPDTDHMWWKSVSKFKPAPTGKDVVPDRLDGG